MRAAIKVLFGVVVLCCLQSGCFASTTASTINEPISPLNLTVTLTNQQLTATGLQCYQLTLDDNTVRQVVFWNSGKLFIRLEPCQGRPHLKVSVYGCPSQTTTVYEYMSAKMVSDAIAQGLQSTIPPSWSWPGDVETLTIDITHKTYYIEVGNYVPAGASGPIPSVYNLYTNIFDANSTTPGAPTSQASLFPLVYMSTNIWSRTITRDNSSDSATSFSFGGSSTSNVVTLDFNPPGIPGTTPASSVFSTPYQYSFFVLEITNSVGTSSGIFSSIVAGLCPTDGECTTSNCRTCPTSYPNCPKEFLTDCTETTLNIATLKTALANATLPFDAYVKDPTQWTAWTVCGANLTMNRVDGSTNYNPNLNQASRQTTPLAWYSQSGPQITQTGNNNQLAFSIQGLLDSNNNVYLVNIAVQNTASASFNTSTPETAIYNFMTLQMRTPRYQTPTLGSTDYAVIIGVSCGLGACIVIFVGVAIIVRYKRKQKLAQRIRMKK